VACHGSCTNIGSSSANCGACDNACGEGERCIAGQCQAQADCGGACGDDQLCCDGEGASVCLDIVTLATDADHCGGCGACAATEACVDDRCCERDGQPVNGNCCNRDVDGNGHCGNQDVYSPSGPGAGCVGGSSDCDRGPCLGSGFDQRCCYYDGLPVQPSTPGHPFYCCTEDLDQDGLCGVDSCRPAGQSCDPAAPDCCVGRCQTRLDNGASFCCWPDGVTANRAFCCNGDPDGDGVCGP
jgi:hypothetical protein